MRRREVEKLTKSDIIDLAQTEARSLRSKLGAKTKKVNQLASNLSDARNDIAAATLTAVDREHQFYWFAIKLAAGTGIGSAVVGFITGVGVS